MFVCRGLPVIKSQRQSVLWTSTTPYENSIKEMIHMGVNFKEQTGFIYSPW